MVSTRGQQAIMRECSICMECKATDEYPPEPPTDMCEHPILTCTDCVHAYHSHVIQDTYNTQIECPNCDARLLERNLYKAATSTNVRTMICRFIRIRSSTLPSWRYCLNSDCGWGQHHDSIPSLPTDNPTLSMNVMVCENCESHTCVTCDRPLHRHETCAQWAQRNFARLVEEKITARTVGYLKSRGVIKACPCCTCLVERSDPIPRAKCGRCNFHFNWKDA